MAELVKEYSYTQAALTELAICISTPRFQPYRNRANNNELLAMEDYLYNLRVSKSLLYPLNVCEVVLRNAASDVLKADFSQAWHRNPAFTDLLVPKTRELLQKAISATNTANVDDVVSELNLGFWFHLFRSNHYPLWKIRFHRVVRAMPTLSFSEFEPRLRNISMIRNRIAHHEGVLALPPVSSPSNVLNDINYIVSAISRDASEWLGAHTTLNKAIRTRPSANGMTGPTVGERCDDRFDLVGESTLLSDLNPKRVSIVIEEEKILGVLGPREFAEFIFSNMDDGLIAINEHVVGEVIAQIEGAKQFVKLQEREGLSGLHAAILKNRYAIIISHGMTVKGVIAAAHRRY